MAIEYTKDRAYRLFDQGKVEGTWNPDDIDLSEDEADWEAFTDEEKRQFLATGSGFYDGEENVTRTLAPYMMALDALDAEEVAFDPIHVEMYISQQVYDEAKHTDFFARWYDQVVGDHNTEEYRVELEGYSTEDLYPTSEEIARAALDGDQEEIVHKLAEGVMAYMGVIEGQGARSGYVRFDQMMESKGEELGKDLALPGFKEGMELIRDDEGRHIGHGQWLLKVLADTDESVVTEVYQPMLENYVDTRLLSDRDVGSNPLSTDEDAIREAAMNYLQETIDIIGRERFDGFDTAAELVESREAVTAASDDDD